MKKKYLFLLTILILGIAATTNGQNIPSYVPSAGLIGWWPFNGNANDESGYNNNGTNNGATLTTDRFGNPDSAYLFNGTSSFISIPSSASLESPTTGITFSAWVYLNGLSLVGQPYAPILTKSNSTGNSFMYRFDIDINATGYFASTNNWTNNIGTAYNFSLNQWYLISAVLDSFTAYFYLNDTLVNSFPFTTNISINTLPLEIGRDVPGITEIFNGKIDDLAIWNRALSHPEITALYTGVNVGIKDPAAENNFSLYPNPANDLINVLTNESIPGSSYTITDQSGKIVQAGKLNSKNTSIPVNDLSNGIYTLTISDYIKRKFSILKN